MKWNDKELIIELTSSWKGERLPDGRPFVSDDLLRRLSRVSVEEAYVGMLRKGYHLQFEGDLDCVNKGRRLIGRAVTAVMVPTRPDVHEYMLALGREQLGYKGFFNQWVIDSMRENDVLVVDMCDKQEFGTFIGGNLSTAIKARTGNGGAVLWGGIRDIEQIRRIPDFNVFHRGTHPSPIGDVMLSGINVPTRIGKAICLPGDVVIGTDAGVIFIPPHLAEYVASKSEKGYVRDMFGFEMLEKGVYTAAQIDQSWWPREILDVFLEWFYSTDKTLEFRHLDWSPEIQLASRPAVEQKLFDAMVDLDFH